MFPDKFQLSYKAETKYEGRKQTSVFKNYFVRKKIPLEYKMLGMNHDFIRGKEIWEETDAISRV